MGFPFFAPAFDPDAIIRIHAGHPDAEQALRRQQEEISFPVPFDWLRAKISFVQLTPGETYEVDGVEVETKLQHHSHVSYGYRFTDSDRRVVIYSTDSEHKLEKMNAEAAFIRFFGDADLVICDTMYSLADSVSMKEDWGHSSNLVAVDLCHEARAKTLALLPPPELLRCIVAAPAAATARGSSPALRGRGQPRPDCSSVPSPPSSRRCRRASTRCRK